MKTGNTLLTIAALYAGYKLFIEKKDEQAAVGGSVSFRLAQSFIKMIEDYVSENNISLTMMQSAKLHCLTKLSRAEKPGPGTNYYPINHRQELYNNWSITTHGIRLLNCYFGQLVLSGYYVNMIPSDEAVQPRPYMNAVEWLNQINHPICIEFLKWSEGERFLNKSSELTMLPLHQKTFQKIPVNQRVIL